MRVITKNVIRNESGTNGKAYPAMLQEVFI